MRQWKRKTLWYRTNSSLCFTVWEIVLGSGGPRNGDKTAFLLQFNIQAKSLLFTDSEKYGNDENLENVKTVPGWEEG